MKPHIMKSYKKEETGQDHLVNNVKYTMRTERIIVPTVTKMMSSALASSSSPCPSSPEAPIPKNISLGH